MRHTYRSKIDTWFIVVLLAALVVSVGSVGIAFINGERDAGPGAIILLLTAAFVCWTAFGTRYILTNQELLVRSGPFRWKIKLKDITGIESVNHMASAPALSRDRLRISYAGKSVMISPNEKQKFLTDLDRRRETLR